MCCLVNSELQPEAVVQSVNLVMAAVKKTSGSTKIITETGWTEFLQWVVVFPRTM